MECSPHFPFDSFDIPVAADSRPSNTQVAHITNDSLQQPNSRYRSRESRPRSLSVVDSTYPRRSSLPTISSGLSESNSYFAQHAIAYSSINAPLTGSSGLSFTPSLLWRSDSVVSRTTFGTARTTTSSSNASSARSKYSSMWGTSDTDGSRRSGLRSFLSLDSAPRTISDTPSRQYGSISSPGHDTNIITFAQAGEAFNSHQNQRSPAVSVDNASSATGIPRLSPIDSPITSRDYCITMDIRTLQDTREASKGSFSDSESFSDKSSAESLWVHALTRPLRLPKSPRRQPPAAPADSPAKAISPILPSTRALSRSPSIATYTTTTTIRSTIKRARRDEALARLEGKFYEAPPMEDKIESFMGFDDDDDECGDKTNDGSTGHLDILSIGLDLQSLPLPKKRESFLVPPHSAGLVSTSSSPHARPLVIASSPGSGSISLYDSPSTPQATRPTQQPKAKARERAKDMRVQIMSPSLAILSSQPSTGTPLPSSGGTPPPTSATTISSRNASPSSLSSFAPIFDEPPRTRQGKRRNREKVKKDRGFPKPTGSLESLFSIAIQTGDGESPKLNRFEFETWLELDGDDSGVDGTSRSFH